MRPQPWEASVNRCCVVSPLVACYPGGVKATAEGPELAWRFCSGGLCGPSSCMAALAAGAAVLAYYLAGRSLPEYDATVAVAGPDQPIEIVRDRYAVPHILSRTDHDAYFGLGFVHAEDRLWQMMLMRRTVQGRLSEMFGRDTLPIDELMRALDLYGYARQAVAVQTTAGAGRARGLCGRRERPPQAGAETGAGAGGAGVLPVLAGHRALDSGRLDRGAEALRAPAHRQGGNGDAPGAALAGAAAGAAARHPAGRAQCARHGAAGLLGHLPGRSPERAGQPARRGAEPARPAAAPRAGGGLERLRGERAADHRRRAAPGERPPPGPERALDLDAGANGPRSRAGDGGHDPRHPGGDHRAQRRSRLGPHLQLPRRPGRLYRETRSRRSRANTSPRAAMPASMRAR